MGAKHNAAYAPTPDAGIIAPPRADPRPNTIHAMPAHPAHGTPRTGDRS